MTLPYIAIGLPDVAIDLFSDIFKSQHHPGNRIHDDALATLTRLGRANECAGRLNDAISVYEDVYVTNMQLHGPRNVNTVRVEQLLAHAYFDAQRFTAAITIFKTIYTRQLRYRRKKRPDTLDAKAWLARSYHRAGRLFDALHLYEELVAECQTILEPDHPLITTVCENLEAARRELAQQKGESGSS